jgi:hypothetical protein
MAGDSVTAFVLIDESGGATTSLGMAMTPAVLGQIAAACQVQLDRDLRPHWGGDYSVRAGKDGSDVQPGEIVFALLAALPDAPGAIAYHATDGSGVAVAYDAITLSDSLMGAGNSVSVAISHELCETAGDAGCNVWTDDGTGTEHARELCDAVEAQSYQLDATNVWVSNFVLPAFFIPNHAGKFDFMSTLGVNPGAPFMPFQTSPGGYQILRTSGTGEHQETARPLTVTVSATIPFGSMRRHWRFDSRRARRGVASP